ncbi:hypothetical protein F3Y22_tig00111099pilonHSYRG00050 [Hibiscus syriacus]|uniref:RRM domain-containing protein n=1 Tax=Hibiscus syriacus TaxID=106335 RepID=A0A6A2Z1B2_HIBSY|nr:hypothetical protein F3Y22_tig00111099pilonHSYRG00050 [Hibiscus syriacus]
MSENVKLFIGGISWGNNEERLREHFSSFGEVVEAVIMKDRTTGRARGFGFIVLSDPAVAEEVVKEKHNIDGRMAKKAVPRDDQNIMSRSASSIQGDFCRRPRGFGFVTYDTEEAVDEVLLKNFHELNGKMVEGYAPRDVGGYGRFSTVAGGRSVFPPFGSGYGLDMNFEPGSVTRNIWGNGGLYYYTNTASSNAYTGSGSGSIGGSAFGNSGNIIGSYLWLRVVIDIGKPICRSLVFGRRTNGSPRLYLLKYERFPNFCFRCGIIRQVTAGCPQIETELDQPAQFRELFWVPNPLGVAQNPTCTGIVNLVPSRQGNIGASSTTEGAGQTPSMACLSLVTGPRSKAHKGLDILFVCKSWFQRSQVESIKVYLLSLSDHHTDVVVTENTIPFWFTTIHGHNDRRYHGHTLNLLDHLCHQSTLLWVNPGYSCFTFNQEDMVPTIEEYITLLHCESIKLERAYIKHFKSQPFKNRLAKIVGVDEKWILGCIDAAVVELFEQLPKRVNPAPTILAETFRSLNHCRRAGGVGYAPLLALRHNGARQFVPATCGLAKSEFEYHGDNYKKMIKEVVDSWKKVFRMDVVAARNMLTPDYVEWRRLRKNGNIPVPDSKIEFEAMNNELKQRKKVCFELEDLRNGYQDKVKDNFKLKVASEYCKDEAHSLKRKFEGPDIRAWKEQMKTAQRRLADSQHQNQCLRIHMANLEKQHEIDDKTIAELEAIVDGFKKKVSELQIVLFDGGLQWRFHWEQAQQRVKARDAVIRDFLDQVQKEARHLHGLDKAGQDDLRKESPYPKDYDVEAVRCYHIRTPKHSSENYKALKRKIQNLMDSGA